MELETILVLEKDILVRQPLAKYLRDCGYRVLEAVDDDEARAYLASGKAAVDVALIGLKSIPSENGFAFASWVRLNHPNVQVLLGGTVTKVLRLAGELCDDGPHGPIDHGAVLDHIRLLLAARERGGGSSARVIAFQIWVSTVVRKASLKAARLSFLRSEPLEVSRRSRLSAMWRRTARFCGA